MNILTLSKNLGDVRLDQLDETLYTKIITRGNQVLPEGFQIASNMCGNDINELYLGMPTDVKTSCLAVIFVEKKEHAVFLANVREVEQHFVLLQEQDNTIKDYTVSMIALILMVVALGVVAFYMATSPFRGDVPDSHVLRLVVQWLHTLTTMPSN